MAVTIAQSIGGSSVAPESSSHLFVSAVDVTGDTSYVNTGTYATSGYAVTPSSYVPSGARVVSVVPAQLGGGFVPQWDVTNSRLHLFSSNGAAPAALAEVTNTTSVAASITRLNIFFEGI